MVGILSAGRLLGSSGTSFSPLSLFAASEQGVWYDPSDFTTMFKDTAQTSPVTAVGDSVACILDKSGRGNHATQSVAASRPTLQQDNTGRYYLNFDGIDDWLVTGSINFSSTNKFTAYAGIMKNGAAASSIGLLFELSFDTNSNSGAFAAFAPFNGSTNPGVGMASKGTTTVFPNTSSGQPSDVAFVLRFVGDISAPLARIFSNGVQVSQVTTTQGTGSYGNYPIYIGRRGGVNLTYKGRVYSLIIRGSASAAAETASTEAWVNKRTGAY